MDAPRAAACLGVLEYLHDAEAFLRALREGYEVAVVSYNVADGQPLETRRGHAWVNDHKLAELEDAFARIGWRVDRRERLAKRQHLWRLVRAAPAVAREIAAA